MKCLAKIIVFSILSLPTLLTADNNPDIDLDHLFAEKRELVKETLQLTEKESAVFWPLYDEYKKNRVYIFNRYSALLKKYMQEREGLSDNKAEEMMSELSAIQTEDLESRRAYFKKLSKKLPYKRVFQYFIFEERVETGLHAFIA